MRPRRASQPHRPFTTCRLASPFLLIHCSVPFMQKPSIDMPGHRPGHFNPLQHWSAHLSTGEHLETKEKHPSQLCPVWLTVCIAQDGKHAVASMENTELLNLMKSTTHDTNKHCLAFILNRNRCVYVLLLIRPVLHLFVRQSKNVFDPPVMQ